MLKTFNEYFEANKHDDPPINFADVNPLYQAPPFPAHPDAGNLPADQKSTMETAIVVLLLMQ